MIEKLELLQIRLLYAWVRITFSYRSFPAGKFILDNDVQFTLGTKSGFRLQVRDNGNGSADVLLYSETLIPFYADVNWTEDAPRFPSTRSAPGFQAALDNYNRWRTQRRILMQTSDRTIASPRTPDRTLVYDETGTFMVQIDRDTYYAVSDVNPDGDDDKEDEKDEHALVYAMGGTTGKTTMPASSASAHVIQLDDIKRRLRR
ncbi:MAG: hypothetical protein ABIG66_02475 [Candidatus Kerfeldbacteria bacterium]